MSNGSSSLDWPSDFARTDPADREPYPHNFRVELREAFRNVLAELEHRDVENARVESAANHLANDPNIPYADANPDDPGVVAYYSKGGQEFAVPCDRWDSLRDNAQAIAKYLNAKRALERYGVETVSGTSEMVTQVYSSG
jgi:hypothetical protein